MLQREKRCAESGEKRPIVPLTRLPSAILQQKPEAVIGFQPEEWALTLYAVGAGGATCLSRPFFLTLKNLTKTIAFTYEPTGVTVQKSSADAFSLCYTSLSPYRRLSALDVLVDCEFRAFLNRPTVMFPPSESRRIDYRVVCRSHGQTHSCTDFLPRTGVLHQCVHCRITSVMVVSTKAQRVPTAPARLPPHLCDVRPALPKG
ncbi:hypothetical protein B0T24DRAFT_368847 [Lasiosphaeria ovina]|uniref:Uncharacterized protein n=1 Tax=Lasiosphaeria ovina TaxID=92902 RepID=A0AAE0N1N3_9PEZI|nr:hypothetical protein B0T24DRAFT_368847 [Lasiosphaeria ovina]